MNDFFFRADDGALRFNPLFEGPAPLIHPLFWAKASHEGDGYSVEIVKSWEDTAKTAIRAIEVPAAVHGVSFRGAPLERIASSGEYATYALPSPVSVKAGSRLDYSVAP